MTPKIKKIIAKEGLIILSLSLIVFFAGIAHNRWWWKSFERYVAEHPNAYMNTIEDSWKYFSFILFGLYILQWLIRFIIRFIIWAVKTLKEK